MTDWSYLAALALEKTTGTGGMVYVAEFGAPSSIGEIKVTSAGGQMHADRISQIAGRRSQQSRDCCRLELFRPGLSNRITRTIAQLSGSRRILTHRLMLFDPVIGLLFRR